MVSLQNHIFTSQNLHRVTVQLFLYKKYDSIQVSVEFYNLNEFFLNLNSLYVQARFCILII